MRIRSLQSFFTRSRNLTKSDGGTHSIQVALPALDHAQLEDRILYSASPVDLDLLGASDAALATEVAWDLPDSDALVAFTPQTLGFDEFNEVPLGLVDAAGSAVESELPVELLVVDARVDNWEELLRDTLENKPTAQLEVLMLDADADGIEQISDALQQLRDVSAIHLVSHGTEGEIQLGNTTLKLGNLKGYGGQLAAWRDALARHADLLIYGCDLASSEAGRSLVESLSSLTGADVAASVDATGYAPLGGDWELEYTTGSIESVVAFSQNVQQSWTGLLAVATVDTTDDIVDGDTSSIASLIATPGADGFISLREAIIAANNSAGADEITLPSGTYALTIAGTGEDASATGDLDITDALTINGAGAATTIIDGGAIDRVLDVADTVFISGVTVTNGDTAADGGGILVDGVLTLTDASVSGNSADSGGGLRAVGSSSIILERVTVSGNTAGIRGGAIHVNGGGASLDMTNVTISGNSAGTDGGGIATNRIITSTNSTIASNSASAGGGIYVFGGGDVILKNTILANNIGGNSNAALTSLGNNIDSGNTAGLTGLGDQINTDPLLGALQDNGGPTQTHALLVGSPAIGAGTNAGAPTVDQRGFTRDAATDVGAYEFGGGPNSPPTITASSTPNIDENLTAVQTLTATDPDGHAVGFTITGGADAAQFSIDISDQLVFLAAPDYEAPADVGTDNVYEVEVTAVDGYGGSDVQLILVSVADVDEFDVGVISDTDASVNQVGENAANGTAVGITALAADPDATDTVSYSLDDDANGRFQIDAVSGVITVGNGSRLDYESATNHTVVVRATSTDTSFRIRSFTIDLIDQNDNAPVVTAGQLFNVDEDAASGTVLGTALATDVDTVGAPTGWAITSGNTDGIFTVNPLTGELAVLDNTLLDFEATSSHILGITVSDGVNSSAVETVVVDVNNVNEAPTVAGPVTAAVTEDDLLQTVNLLAGATDPDGDPLNVPGLTLVTGDARGITVAGNRLQLNPAAYNGLALGAREVIRYTYDVSDGAGGLAPQTVTITITGFNDAPVAVDDLYAANTGTPLVIPSSGVLGNDADVEGDPVTVAVVANPSNGVVTLNADGSFTYTSNIEFVGTDTFQYAATDPLGAYDTATVTINVHPVAAPPPSSGGNDPPPDQDRNDDSEEDESDVLTAAAPPPHTQETHESNPRRRGSATSHVDGVVTVAATVTVDASGVSTNEATVSTQLRSKSNLLGIDNPAQASALRMRELDFNTVSTALYDGLSKLEDGLMSAVRSQTWSVGYALGVTTGLSVGYVLWILRSGYLLTSVLSSMAPWMMVDPLLVLDVDGRDKHRRVGMDDSLESMMDS